MDNVDTKKARTLPYLFFGNILERFAFYIVQGMFVIFFTQEYHYSDNDAYTLLGVFLALAFMAPLLGGYLADRIIGVKVAIITGAIYLCIGYYLLSVTWEHSDFFALAALIIGNGLYKPNVSALLGAMHETSDTKSLEKDFFIFYLAIHIGILLAGLISGDFKSYWGWRGTFVLSTLSLLMGLITFILCIKLTKINYKIFEKLFSPKPFLTMPWVLLYTVIAVPIIGFFLEAKVSAEWILSILGIILIVFFFFLVSKQQISERKNLFILGILFLSIIIFWSLSLQPYFSLSLYIHDLGNHSIGPIRVHTTYFYALISFYVILMLPLFARLWRFFKYCKNVKYIFLGFISCMVCLAIAFYIISLSGKVLDSNPQVNLLWVVVAYFFFALAEIIFSAIGLSAVSLLASDKLLNSSVVMWFIATGFGAVYAGWVAKRTDIPDAMQNKLEMITIYYNGFIDFAWFSLVMAVILTIVYVIINRISYIRLRR